CGNAAGRREPGSDRPDSEAEFETGCRPTGAETPARVFHLRERDPSRETDWACESSPSVPMSPSAAGSRQDNEPMRETQRVTVLNSPNPRSWPHWTVRQRSIVTNARRKMPYTAWI